LVRSIPEHCGGPYHPTRDAEQSATLPFVIPAGGFMGLRPTQGDEKRLLSSNYSPWKRRPTLCHPERSRGICSSADLSWKCFRQSVAKWRDLLFLRRASNLTGRSACSRKTNSPAGVLAARVHSGTTDALCGADRQASSASYRAPFVPIRGLRRCAPRTPAGSRNSSTSPTVSM
jgi:hypothetical protein